MGNEFSVLMLVYGGDQPAHFDAALRSITGQTLPPAEIVLVVDGPVPDETEHVIRNCEEELKTSAVLFRVIRSEKNLGCGGAKRLGIAPEEALVVEDSLHCIKTARKAGFPTAAIYDEANAAEWEDIKAFSDMCFKDLNGAATLFNNM